VSAGRPTLNSMIDRTRRGLESGPPTRNRLAATGGRWLACRTMKSLVVLSFAAPDHRSRDRLVERARRALRAVTGRAATVDLATDLEHLLVDGRDDLDVVDRQGSISVGLSLGAWDEGGRLVHPAAYPDASLDPAWPSSMVPPFAACIRRRDGDPFVFVTDACGIRHVYLVEGDGWSACATSSLVLAATAGRSVDGDSSSVAALAGHQLGDRTPFRAVRRLAAGHRLALRAGGIACSPFTTPRRRDPRPHAAGSASRFRTLVDHGAGAISGAVGDALAAHPDAGLELSGGLDSRMILAAVPPAERAGRWALTIASTDSPDADVARRLAAACRIDHQVVDLGDLAHLEPEEALGLVRHAALRRDATADPVAGAVLDFVSTRTQWRALLTGQNGEYARGYYYSGQPLWPRATRALVRYLARWRILTSAPADGALFGGRDPEVRRRAVDELEARLAGIGGPWPAATDELYLVVRMQNWVGRDFSTACTERQVLAPFFHPAFLGWARDLPRSAKAGSRAFAAVLEELDPRLAMAPLDTGVRPSDLACPSARGRAASLGRFGRKALRKVSLRVRPGPGAKPPVGAAALAELVRHAWAADPGALSRLGSLDFLDRGMVEAIASGRRVAGPATVGFLAGLDVALEVLWDAGG